jgi:hypothetical protein
MGYRGEPGVEHRLEFEARHAIDQGAWTKSLIQLRFHGDVQKHFLVELESDTREAARIGRVRQDRIGYRTWKLESAQAVPATVTQIVDDDTDGG